MSAHLPTNATPGKVVIAVGGASSAAAPMPTRRRRRNAVCEASASDRRAAKLARSEPAVSRAEAKRQRKAIRRIADLTIAMSLPALRKIEGELWLGSSEVSEARRQVAGGAS